jgi:predicted nucleotidyltransferase component of viral defense system
MIRNLEIKEIAREFAVPETTIEKDYALSWILNSLHRHTNSLVLKGGTGIRKTYIKNYRFSEDLDFTMLTDMSQIELENTIKKTIMSAKLNSSIDFHNDIRTKENVNGYRIDVYFRITRQSGMPLRIKFDITKYGKEELILPIVENNILHPYSDDCIETVLAYSIHEVMAEKFRSIFERTRPRDLYDIWYVPKQFNIEQALEIFPQKCNFKGIKPKIESVVERKNDFANAWKNSLVHQMKKPPEFEQTFDETIEFLKTFEFVR